MDLRSSNNPEDFAKATGADLSDTPTNSNWRAIGRLRNKPYYLFLFLLIDFVTSVGIIGDSLFIPLVKERICCKLSVLLQIVDWDLQGFTQITVYSCNVSFEHMNSSDVLFEFARIVRTSVNSLWNWKFISDDLVMIRYISAEASLSANQVTIKYQLTPSFQAVLQICPLSRIGYSIGYSLS